GALDREVIGVGSELGEGSAGEGDLRPQDGKGQEGGRGFDRAHITAGALGAQDPALVGGHGGATAITPWGDDIQGRAALGTGGCGRTGAGAEGLGVSGAAIIL